MIPNLLLLLIPLVHSTEFTLKTPAWGVVHLVRSTSQEYLLKFALTDSSISPEPPRPADFGDGDRKKKLTLTTDRNLILLDANGLLGEIKPGRPFLFQEWCSNDGGHRYRAFLQISVPKAKLKRALKPDPKRDSIVAAFTVGDPGKLAAIPALPGGLTEGRRVIDRFRTDSDILAELTLAPEPTGVGCSGVTAKEVEVLGINGPAGEEVLSCCAP
jgi:hypothetical protein